MSNVEIVELKVNIPKATYDELVALTKRQNAQLGNNVGRLIARGIQATYDKFPHLKDAPNDT